MEDTLNRIYSVRLPCLIKVEKCLLTVKHANGIATVMRSYSLLITGMFRGFEDMTDFPNGYTLLKHLYF